MSVQNRRSVTILDGGMGRELEKRGAPFKQPEWSAQAMMVAPETVKEAHKAFITSGAGVITTNSYALVPFHIGEKKFAEQGRELAARAGEMARNAVVESAASVLVAGSIPPLFGSYRPDLYRAGQVEELVTPLVEGLSAYVDLWLCETASLIAEPLRVKSIIDRLGNLCKPFWVSFTLEDFGDNGEPLLRSGESVADAVKAMVGVEVDAILFNCCQPEVISQAVKVTRQILTSLGMEHIATGAYANAFPPQSKDAAANELLNELREDLTPSSYLNCAQRWVQDGATIVGGCCGIGPQHIAVLSQELG